MAKQPTPLINAGKPWSQSDFADLHGELVIGNSIEDVALFLCRSVDETAAKADEHRLPHHRGGRAAPFKRFASSSAIDRPPPPTLLIICGRITAPSNCL
jgi:hypothetical protein